MQWTDEGIVLGVKRHGEANAILELMTREHGRHLGLVRGGFGSRLKPVPQPRPSALNSEWKTQGSVIRDYLLQSRDRLSSSDKRDRRKRGFIR